MRLSRPRVAPIPMPAYRALVESLFGETVTDESAVLNIARTWAHHPDLMAAHRPYQRHLRGGSPLPRRDHELAVLRIGWLCRAEYEFAQHAVFARRAGLTDEEIARVTAGPDAPGWDGDDALVLRTVDELYADNMISEGTWSALSDRYTVPQRIELLALVGRYWTVSVVANSLGVQVEPGKSGFPGRAAFDSGDVDGRCGSEEFGGLCP